MIKPHMFMFRGVYMFHTAAQYRDTSLAQMWSELHHWSEAYTRNFKSTIQYVNMCYCVYMPTSGHICSELLGFKTILKLPFYDNSKRMSMVIYTVLGMPWFITPTW